MAAPPINCRSDLSPQRGTEQPGAAPGSFSKTGLKTVLTSVAADVGVQWAAHNRPLIPDSGRHGRNKMAACQRCLAPIIRCVGIQTSISEAVGYWHCSAELQPWPPCFRAAASCEQLRCSAAASIGLRLFFDLSLGSQTSVSWRGSDLCDIRSV